jgi:high-affinity nickel-transport protein
VLTNELGLHGRFWDTMANFNINLAGLCIAGLFVAVWAFALVFWRWGNVETRWGSNVTTANAAIQHETVGP